MVSAPFYLRVLGSRSAFFACTFHTTSGRTRRKITPCCARIWTSHQSVVLREDIGTIQESDIETIDLLACLASEAWPKLG